MILIRNAEPWVMPPSTRTCSAEMLTGVEKQSGLTLPDDNIRAQCITFLVAGHETTSGLLSFAIYFLLEHPNTSSELVRKLIRCSEALCSRPSIRCMS